MHVKPLYAAIEAGGTKILVSVGRDYQSGVQCRIPTEDPNTTLEKVVCFIREQIKLQGPIEAIGLASFGPIGVNASANDYGQIGKTPKPYWSNVNLHSALIELGVPVIIESDVNGAALAESKSLLPANQGRLVYVTIGTGLGAGVADRGHVSNGVHHPEMGHITVARHPRDTYEGHCPFHQDCLEGLVCGPAIIDHWGLDLSQLEPEHEAHEITSFYLGQLCANIFLTYAPDIIILGGGVSLTPGLIERIRDATHKQLGGYLQRFNSRDAMSTAIQAPSLGTHSGIAGAYLLATTGKNSIFL